MRRQYRQRLAAVTHEILLLRRHFSRRAAVACHDEKRIETESARAPRLAADAAFPRSLRNDRDRTVLEVDGVAARSEKRTGTVLLDSGGRVVGVDLRGDDERGVVVMFGAHESVASTRAVEVEVGLTSGNEVASVTIEG